jgi:hypothetical protein
MKKLFLLIAALTVFALDSSAQTKKDGTPDMRYRANKEAYGNTYSTPAQSYSAPVQTYSAPAPTYSVPSSSGPAYGGGTHTESHGGTYIGGSTGSSHKGGTYVNPNTSNQYGTHKP